MENQAISIYNELRPYQQRGTQFLIEREYALLADEMGLGKTVQAAVSIYLLFQKQKIQNALIVCPTSLKLNWKRELNKWCPAISVTVVKGDAENRHALFLLPFNIWIASYEQIRNDRTFLKKHLKYDLVILDEDQRIKNKDSRISTSCKLLSRNISWAISGTPLENNIEDLISISTFLKYGLIDPYQSFKTIKDSIKPFFLRRTKKEVLPDLPPILEQEVLLELLDEQHASYLEVLDDSRNEINTNSNISQLFSIIISA